MNRSLLPLLLLAAACTPGRMAVPAPLADTPEWRVEWSGGSRLRFGPYEAHDIRDRGRQRGGILDALTGKREYQQSYTFLLRDTAAAADAWSVRCDHRDVERRVGVRGIEVQLDDRTSLECTLNPPGDPSAPWTLGVSRRGDRMPAGELAQGQDSAAYRVRAQTHDGGGCCEVAGFLIRREDDLVVSVDRGDRGWIRMAPAAPERDRLLLAAAAAALLIANEMAGYR
jgi:hypothetical protein